MVCVVSVTKVWWPKPCASCWENRTTNRTKFSPRGTTQVLHPQHYPRCYTGTTASSECSDDSVFVSRLFAVDGHFWSSAAHQDWSGRGYGSSVLRLRDI